MELVVEEPGARAELEVVFVLSRAWPEGVAVVEFVATARPCRREVSIAAPGRLRRRAARVANPAAVGRSLIGRKGEVARAGEGVDRGEDGREVGRRLLDGRLSGGAKGKVRDLTFMVSGDRAERQPKVK